MSNAVSRRVVVAVTGLTALLAGAPADAQFSVPGGPATGETFHIEAGLALWNATPSLIVASEALGIAGTDVDLVNDLGIGQKRLPEMRLVLRPARKHKFRIHYLPIKYDAESVVRREFVFNAQRYMVGLPVNTMANLQTYRFGYQYDFLALDRGFAGVLLDIKYTDTTVSLESPIGSEYTAAIAPIPTLGFVGRGYVTNQISITGEMSFFKLPENLSDDYKGRYIDFDIYGTYNFTPNVGAQLGYRSIDVFYQVNNDRGDLQFRGMYLSGVVRF